MSVGQDELLTVNEAAAEFRVSSQTVRRWIKEGKLRAIRQPGGGIRITRADIVAAMEPVAREPAPPLTFVATSAHLGISR